MSDEVKNLYFHETCNSTKYSVTVGIPTKNRKDKILNCLKALENQTFKDFNVIIVDGSEEDETKEICLNFSKCMNIVYIKSLKPSVSRARKLIAEKCQSELLLYIDDDVYLLKDCISKLFSRYKNLKNRDNYIISGQIEYFGNLTTPIKLTPDGVGFSVSASNADYIISALMFVPKAIFQNILWTERFVTWGFEEVLYCLMCRRHGANLSWINSLLAVHDNESPETRFSVGTETNRAYTMLYKHVVMEPSLVNLLILESVGFIRFFIINLLSYLFSPKKLVLFMFSYISSWAKGHLWFLNDLANLKVL